MSEQNNKGKEGRWKKTACVRVMLGRKINQAMEWNQIVQSSCPNELTEESYGRIRNISKECIHKYFFSNQLFQVRGIIISHLVSY